MNRSKKIKVLLLSLSFTLILSIGITYAYFTATITNNGNSEVIHSGTMSIHYSEGRSVNLSNALPGSSVTKTFSVENTGTLDTNYTVYFSELLNEYVDRSDLVY